MPTLHTTPPASVELTGLVRSIWSYQGCVAHAYEQILPSVTSQLLINLHENQLRHWVVPGGQCRTVGSVGVQGVLTAPVVIDTAQKRNLCGVAFTSFGLSAFCNASASRFTNSLFDASQLWGTCIEDLRTTLIECADPAEQCMTIEKFLVERLIAQCSENALLEKIVNAIAAGNTLSDIRHHTGLSQRGFHKLFDRRIGVRPKTYARLDRFCALLGTMSGNGKLIDHAFDCGFSDQAHLTREFRAFAGIPPTQHHPIANEDHHVKISADILFKKSGRD